MSDLQLLPSNLPWMVYLGMGAMVLVGSCLQGVSGLGFAMFCAPIGALVFPELVPGPLLALACPLALMTGMRELHAIQWPTAAQAVLGRAIGTALASLCLALLPLKALSLLFAALILLGVVLSLKGWRVANNARNTALAGVASGLMGTITSAGAPPFAIAMQDMSPHRLRGTLGVVFFLGSTMSLAALVGVGRMSAVHFGLALLLAPWMVVGFFVSTRFKHLIGQQGLRTLLLGLAALSAMGILVQTLVHP